MVRGVARGAVRGGSGGGSGGVVRGAVRGGSGGVVRGGSIDNLSGCGHSVYKLKNLTTRISPDWQGLV